MTLAFNPQYLLDGLNALDAPTAAFSFVEPGKPVVLAPASEDGEVNPGYRYLSNRCGWHASAGDCDWGKGCDSAWWGSAGWAATCGTACARPGTRCVTYDRNPDGRDTADLAELAAGWPRRGWSG